MGAGHVAQTDLHQTGTLEGALANAARLLVHNPAKAEEQAREILKVAPGHPQAEYLLGAALRIQGDVDSALEILEALGTTQPKAPGVAFELGLARADAGQSEAAIAALERAVKLAPGHAQAWRALGDCRMLAGDSAGADAAYARHLKASVNDPVLLEAGAALCANRLAVAEHSLRGFLKEHPTDIGAIRMLAQVGARLGRYEDAENLLTRCLELAPSFDAARYNLASVLMRQNKTVEALEQVKDLLKRDPRNPAYRTLQASGFARVGEYQKTIEGYEAVLKGHPNQPKAWMSYGHAPKTVGRTDD